jgi:oxygen-dependent protoporphyrinogen oxidase
MPSPTQTSTVDTAIIGAGITGLCVAHSIYQHSGSGSSFNLIESSHQLGGAIQSTISDGYLAEHGPNSILVKDKRIAELLTQAGLNNDETASELLPARPEATKRYIVQNGQTIAIPGTPISLVRSPLFTIKGKMRLLLEPFIARRLRKQSEESFADFVRRRFGTELLASAAAPFVSGIYAGNPETLSVRHAFPRLWAIEQKYRSIILGFIAQQFGFNGNPHQLKPSRIVSFRSGMHALPKAIAKGLPQNSIKLGAQISSIETNDAGWTITWKDQENIEQRQNYRNLVITIPPHKLSNLPLPDKLHHDLRPIFQIESPPVTSLTLGFKREDVAHPLDGFGMLIKQDENSPLLGVLFSSSMFDGRAPDGHVTLTCMMGGSINPQYAENNDQVVLDELHKLLGVTGAPTFRHQTSWPRAIPQYSLNYQDKLDTMIACEQSHRGLHLAGNYREGISVIDCMLNGLDLGKQLSQQHQIDF